MPGTAMRAASAAWVGHALVQNVFALCPSVTTTPRTRHQSSAAEGEVSRVQLGIRHRRTVLAAERDSQDGKEGAEYTADRLTSFLGKFLPSGPKAQGPMADDLVSMYRGRRLLACMHDTSAGIRVFSACVRML